MRVCADVNLSMLLHVYLFVGFYVCVIVSYYIHLHHVCMHVYTYVGRYIYGSLCIFVPVYSFLCLCMCTCVCKCAYVMYMRVFV